ncbi:MAG: type II secretion system protein [Lachnospiraceae bacterium]|nr:type II secretion system protein [Lachnospiraceae bacterium]
MTAGKKLHSRRGFTLAEMLATVLILLMVSSIVAAGIPAAVRAYEKVVRSANAEVLLSTSVSALRSELGTAREISVTDSTVLQYYNERSGSFRSLYPDNESEKRGVLTIREYLGLPEETGAGTGSGTDTPGSGSGNSGGNIGTGGSGLPPRQLVTDAAATGDLYVTYSSASVEDGIVTIGGLSVRRQADPSVSLAEVETLKIRTFYRE